jgi:flagellar protein FliL
MATNKAAKAAPPETDNDEAEGAEAAPAGKGFSIKALLSRKLIIIAAAGALVLGVAGGGAYHFLGARTSEAAPASNIKPPIFVDLPEVLVNLSSTGNDRTQYLKVKVVLEVPDESVKTQIEPLMPRLMDTFQTYLRELRATDLDGSAGLYRLKEELTRRVNAAIAPERINAVLFKEIVVQ